MKTEQRIYGYRSATMQPDALFASAMLNKQQKPTVIFYQSVVMAVRVKTATASWFIA